ncbi:MAG: hypothetical protein A4E65_00176 [Syntrophorhabdus sp. PtaU1.Bin153]|nr:MAG: hypothetical protein A4E65_00176 [Syntrophorhabdus sp. PtaU1.Bin153]
MSYHVLLIPWKRKIKFPLVDKSYLIADNYNKGKSCMGLSEPTSMIFNVLVKKDEGLYIAHCLELDLVATSEDANEVTSDILDLIKAQVNYAFLNDNLAYLYHPAPTEVWEEFYACKEQIEKKVNLRRSRAKNPHRFIPPWIIARTCRVSEQTCHV